MKETHFPEYEFNFSYENSNYVTLTSRSNASNFLSHIIWSKCEFHVFHLNNFHLLIIIDIKPDAWRKKYTFIICRQIKNNPLHLKRHHHSSNGSFLIMYHLHTYHTQHTFKRISYLVKYSGSDIFHNCYIPTIIATFCK